MVLDTATEIGLNASETTSKKYSKEQLKQQAY